MHAGRDRRQAERHRQEQRNDEEDPALHQVQEEERADAVAQLDVPQHLRVDQCGLAACDTPVLPRAEQAHHHAAGEHEPDHRRESEPFWRSRLGLYEPPRARAQDADHDQPKAGRRQRGADQVELGALLGRCVVHPPRQSEDQRHDQHFADEHPPPRGVGREHAADHRPGCSRDRAGGRHQPVGTRPLGPREVRSDERHDRRHDQDRAESLQERPADDQHRQAVRQRGRQRPTRVDHAPERKRTLAADDLPDPPAGDHERRHHQRVQRDRRLDPGHIGADVFGDRRDRRVHHRHIQGHHELPRRQREQHQTRSLGGSRRSARCSRHNGDPNPGVARRLPRRLASSTSSSAALTSQP